MASGAKRNRASAPEPDRSTVQRPATGSVPFRAAGLHREAESGWVRLRELKAQQQAHEQAAKAAQNEGDALYWPIYNLDLKNPNGKAGLEHADPKDLIASMRGHEAEVIRLLGEIEALVNEVQA